MSTFHQQLYSVGPQAVGSGTYVTIHRLNPTRSRGVITNLLEDPAGITTNDLSAKVSLVPVAYPGTTIPLAFTTVRMMDNNQALIIATYSQDQTGDGGFRRVFQATPTVTRTRLVYDYPGNDRAENRDERGAIIPRRIASHGRVVQWSSVVYSDTGPNLRIDLDDTICSGTYTIDGYVFPAGSLLFNGMHVAHEKYGAYDRWTRHYSATFDPYYWKNQTLTTTPVAAGGVIYTAGPEESLISSDRYVTWPNLP